MKRIIKILAGAMAAILMGQAVLAAPLLGDVNGDGAVTAKDKMTLARYADGWEGYTVDEDAGDIDRDGDVDAEDAQRLGRYFAGYPGDDGIGESAVDPTGFSVKPTATSNDTMTFVPDVDGTIYYYYLSQAIAPEAEDFINLWNIAAFNESISVKKGEVVEEKIIPTIKPHIVFCVYDGEKYYKPVVLNTDNGFEVNPVMGVDYTIDYTSSVEGVLYYYYTAEEKLPATEHIMAAWENAANGGKLSVQTDTAGKISYDNTLQDTPYLVMFIISDGQCMRPYIIEHKNAVDETGFIMIPFVTDEDDQYYLNVTPSASGRVYCYFTNLSYIPTASEFDASYSAATYRDNFYVQSGKNYSEVTIDSAQAIKYDYVVIQLVTDSCSHTPIIIDNVPTYGTGFAVAPYFDSNNINYTVSVAGTVYYYYCNNGENVSSTQFCAGYTEADNAMKGTVDVKTSEMCSIELTERYLENYPFVIMVLKNLNDQYYKPVVIAAGDNGFSEEPEITTLGTIEFKPSVSGTLYYYYTDDETNPTPNDVANDWRVEYGRGSMDVTGDKSGSLKYSTDYTERYPYMVFCIKDSAGDYLTPFVLKVNQDTGFSVNPYVSGSEEISLKAELGGTVYWYFTKYKSVPSSDEFMDEYYNTTSARRGYEMVTSTTTYTSFSFDSSYVEQYPYIAIMLIDTYDETYQPVLIDVKNTTVTGFAVEPYCDLTEAAVYYKTEQSGTVYYYFTRTAVAYNESSEEFWNSYSAASIGYYGSSSVTTSFDYISFADIDTTAYPGIVMMFVDEENNDYYPIYVSLTIDSSSGTSATGITVLSVTSSTVELSVDITGTLTYYFMGYGTNTTTHYGGGSIYANKNSVVTIDHTGRYYYLVVELDGYDPHTIDLTQDYDRDEEVDDGSTKSGYGFSSYNVDYANGQITITGVANVNGIITASVSNVIGSNVSVDAVKGEVFTIVIDYDIDSFMDSEIGQLIGAGTLQIQLTSDTGDVYERLDINLG